MQLEARRPSSFSPARPRLTSGEKLRRALFVLAGGRGTISQHRETPWASITFAGARHDLRIDFAGEDAVAAGEAFIAALPDHEFTLPRILIADAAVCEVDHLLLPEPRLSVRVELLLLDEA